jgi:small subunit ribosomal protein S6e
MADYKLVISDPKTGKSYAKESKEGDVFNGKQIGDKISVPGFEGYEFEITGGSDNCGFPMRKDVDSSRKKILYIGGVGLKKTGHGVRRRKTVCGSRVTAKTAQVNLKILKHGKDALEEKPKEA